MKFCWFLRSVTFVVGFLDTFLGRCLPVVTASRVRVATFFEKLAHFLALAALKSESSLQSRLSPRN